MAIQRLFFRPFKNAQSHGFSLIELMIACGMFAVVMSGMAVLMMQFQRTAASLEYEVDLVELAAEIQKHASCRKTIAAMKAANGGANPVLGTPVTLLRSNGQELFGALGDAGTPFESARLYRDRWYIKSYWNNIGIAVKVAKRSGTSDFAKRPLDGSTLDFDIPNHQLFANNPLCAEAEGRSYRIDMVQSFGREFMPWEGFATDENIIKVMEKPIGISRTCHRLCEQHGYVSGWLIGIAEHYFEPDATGEIVIKDFPPGGQTLWCRCLR